MKDVLKGWKDEKEVVIPPLPRKGEEWVVIRSHIPPQEQAAKPQEREEKLQRHTVKPQERSAVPVRKLDVLADEEATTPLYAAKVSEPEGDDEPTTLLERKVKAYVTLQRARTGERVEVSGDPFVLGKGSDCDYIIRENTSVSRRHGELFQRDGAWFYRDLDSLNHSFVEEKQIAGEIRLEDGMKLTLSDEEFLVGIEVRK